MPLAFGLFPINWGIHVHQHIMLIFIRSRGAILLYCCCRVPGVVNNETYSPPFFTDLKSPLVNITPSLSTGDVINQTIILWINHGGSSLHIPSAHCGRFLFISPNKKNGKWLTIARDIDKIPTRQFIHPPSLFFLIPAHFIAHHTLSSFPCWIFRPVSLSFSKYIQW